MMQCLTTSGAANVAASYATAFYKHTAPLLPEDVTASYIVEEPSLAHQE